MIPKLIYSCIQSSPFPSMASIVTVWPRGTGPVYGCTKENAVMVNSGDVVAPGRGQLRGDRPRYLRRHLRIGPGVGDVGTLYYGIDKTCTKWYYCSNIDVREAQQPAACGTGYCVQRLCVCAGTGGFAEEAHTTYDAVQDCLDRQCQRLGW